MRTYVLVTGILSFASIALGGEAVLFKTKTYTYDASFISQPGSADQSTVDVSVSRKFQFLFPDAKLDSSDSERMALEDGSTIREYLAEDVNDAINEANHRATAANGNYQDYLPKLLQALRYKNVDCRVVARSMVEHLITNRIQLDKTAGGGLTHRYQMREDQLDMAMMAKQLVQVTVDRDPTISYDDKEPRFSCRQTSTSIGPAKCGDLRIKYNPLEAQSGVFKGQNAVVFDRAECAKFEDETDQRSCELRVQVQRCGLKYTQKAEGARAGRPATRGLSDELEANMNAEIRARQDGLYRQVQPAQPGDAGEIQKPDSFLEEFQPGGKGSKQPVD